MQIAMANSFYVWLKSRANAPVWSTTKNSAARISFDLPVSEVNRAVGWEAAVVSLTTTLIFGVPRGEEQKTNLTVLCNFVNPSLIGAQFANTLGIFELKNDGGKVHIHNATNQL